MLNSLCTLAKVCLFGAVVGIALGFGAEPARADAPVIILENRTYSPLHYRVKPSRESYSGWQIILPGEFKEHGGHHDLGIEVWFDENRSEYYDLVGGAIYGLVRDGPRDSPEFLKCRGRATRAPPPPTAPADDGHLSDAQFAPLHQFVSSCKWAKHSYRLSLKKLAADCAVAQKQGELPVDLRYLHGFTWFFGYLVDDENKDVILLGVKDPTRPPLDIDCLASAVQAAASDVAPYCSLEDHTDPSLSKSIIAGVPWKTRYAEVMIQADYEMGQIARGLLKPAISGFKSQVDLRHEIFAAEGLRAEGIPSSEGKLGKGYYDRWWFNFNSEVPRAIADNSGKLVYLYRNPVRLSTEQMVNGAFGSGQTTLSSRRFVASFNEHLETIGQQYPSIAELTALFRLYDLMRHLREVSRADAPAMDFWGKQYVSPYPGPPATMPKTLVSRTIRIREDVPRPVAGASYFGTETLAGYNRLNFDLHTGGRATMHDAKETVHGTWSFAGNEIVLRFYSGSVVYQGTWDESTLSGFASNGKTTWSWTLKTGYLTQTWTSR